MKKITLKTTLVLFALLLQIRAVELSKIELSVNDGWVTRDINQQFHDPIIVTGALTNNDFSSVITEVRNVTPVSFEIRLRAWGLNDQSHDARETVTCLIAENGTQEYGGLKVIAGRKDLGSLSFSRAGRSSTQRITLPSPIQRQESSRDLWNFSLYSQIINSNPSALPYHVRNNINPSRTDEVSFRIELGDRRQVTAHVGEFNYLVIQSGETDGSAPLNIQTYTTDRVINNSFRNISLDSSYQNPDVLLEAPIIRGVHNAAVRHRSLRTGTVGIRVDEPPSYDGGHTEEEVSVLLISTNPDYLNASENDQELTNSDLIDTDNDGLRDSLERAMINCNLEDEITSLEDVTPDGDFDNDGVSNSYETRIKTSPIIPNALSEIMSSEIDSRLAGKDPAGTRGLFQDYINNGRQAQFLRNEEFIFNDVRGFSGVSVWNSSSGHKGEGVLITRRHFLTARHNGRRNGTEMYFLDVNGELHKRTVIGSAGDVLGDLAVGVLDSDLPASVTPLKVLPRDESAVLPYIGQPLLFTNALIPQVTLNQRAEVSISSFLHSREIINTYDASSATRVFDPQRVRFHQNVVACDSSSGQFAILNGELIFIGVIQTAFRGRSVQRNTDLINSLISRADQQATSLSNQEVNTGYTLEAVDLSPYRTLNSLSSEDHCLSPDAHWNFNGAGDTAVDLVGNHNISLTNAEQINGELEFNGQDSMATIPPLVFDNIEDEISIAMWVKISENQSGENTILSAVDDDGDPVINITLPRSDSRIHWQLGNSARVEGIVSRANAVDIDSNYNHWVFTKNTHTGAMSLYKNGELVHRGTNKTEPLNNIFAVYLGSHQGILGQSYAGSIDDLKIYRTELSEQEVMNLFNNETVPAVAAYSFNENNGTVATDASGNGFNASVINGSFSNGALNFNGKDSSVTLPSEVFSSINNEVSVSVWVNGADTQARNDTLLSATDGAGNAALSIHLPWGDSRVYWSAGNKEENIDRISTAAPMSSFKGEWNNWVFTKNATTGKMAIYLNGNLLRQVTGKTSVIRGITEVTLGSNNDGSLSYDGQIEALEIYSTSLSEDEIISIFQSGPF